MESSWDYIEYTVQDRSEMVVHLLCIWTRC